MLTHSDETDMMSTATIRAERKAIEELCVAYEAYALRRAAYRQKLSDIRDNMASSRNYNIVDDLLDSVDEHMDEDCRPSFAGMNENLDAERNG